jgi:hypothetical protein
LFDFRILLGKPSSLDSRDATTKLISHLTGNQTGDFYFGIEDGTRNVGFTSFGGRVTSRAL